jgi:folate-dependent phosphoribosylglycinamide formyltransferase PurN
MGPKNTLDFECEYEGKRQRLPSSMIDRIGRDRPDAIIKFGMGLLQVPALEQLPIPILSYHHGDPRAFRGRPAGFYELLRGQPTVGQVVQILSNKLDAGQVVAFAETKVRPHSYRATMREAYAVSPLLLPQAVRAVMEGRRLDIVASGKAYRLPSPLTVLRFALQRGRAKIRRLAYGAFIEKAWQDAEAPRHNSSSLLPHPFPAPDIWQRVHRPRGYRFLADPFFHPSEEGFLVEALKSSTGLGVILHISADDVRPLLSGPGHFSYPATISSGGHNYLIPEVCEWLSPRIFRLSANGVQPSGEVVLPGPSRLVDPTFFEWNGTVYMFANDASDGGSILRLWMADSVVARFEEHPLSPILISPVGARMGGGIIEQDDGLYRVGQDGRGGYGDGVVLFRIEELSRIAYRERAVSELRFKDYCGPHTLNMSSDRLLFDFYHNRFALLASVRRLRGWLAGRA